MCHDLVTALVDFEDQGVGYSPGSYSGGAAAPSAENFTRLAETQSLWYCCRAFSKSAKDSGVSLCLAPTVSKAVRVRTVNFSSLVQGGAHFNRAGCLLRWSRQKIA
jgi:hypothetical protein